MKKKFKPKHKEHELVRKADERKSFRPKGVSTNWSNEIYSITSGI